MRLRIDIDDTDIAQQLRDIADFLDTSFKDETDAIPFVAWVKHEGADFEDKWRREFMNAYKGEFRNEYHFAEHYYRLFANESPFIEPYINLEAFGNDLFKNDFYKIEADNGIYVFRRT